MPRRNATVRLSSSKVVVPIPVAITVVLVAILIVGSMALDIPRGLWSQAGLSDLRGRVLSSVGPPTPQSGAGARPATAQPGPTARPDSAAAGGTWSHIYFTTPKYPDKEADHHDGIDQYLVALIDKAQRTVDVAAYELDLETVAQAMLQAKKRGVTVRLVTDTDNLVEKAVQELKAGGIPVVDDKRGAIMHDKFVVVDGRYLWTGSWNLTINCTYRNNNNAMWIDSEALARNYSLKLAEMFEKHHFGPSRPPTAQTQFTIEGTRVENYFSPEDHVSDHLATLLRGAQKSIRFMAFSFTDDRLGQILIDRARGGVSVSGVMEERGSDTEYAELGALRKAKIDVLTDGNPYVMHHKVFVVDESIVVTGSFNFTSSADKDNDENVLIIYNRDVAKQYLAEFDRVRQRAAEGSKS